MNTRSSRNICINSFTVAISLTIKGSEKFIEDLLTCSFWREFIPGFSVSVSNETLAHWTIQEQPEHSYDLTSRVITTSDQAFIPAIVIIEAELERMRQIEGLYTLHGSYIGKDDMAVGFIGAISGLGKTTISAYGARHNWTWLGDEKFTITASGVVVGGVGSILNDPKTHDASAGMRPTQDNTPHRLSLICIPLITSEPTVIVHELDRSRREWQFYDEMTRDIRQINGVLHNFSTPLPSLDTNSLSRERLKVAVQLAKSVPIVYIRGNEQAMLKEVETLLLPS